MSLLQFLPQEQIFTPEEIDYESLPKGTTLSSQCIAGATAGILEHTVMYPVDALKTRMQSINQSFTIRYTSTKLHGVFKSIYKISANEGWLSLWRGTSSVILGAGPAHAVYFGTYEYVKSKLIDEIKEKDEDEGQVNLHHFFKIGIAGSAATIVSEALMNPFDVIKQRMQLSQGTPQRSKVEVHHGIQGENMIQMMQKIYKKEGFKAFYYSYPTTITMTIPFTVLNFIMYESTIKIINPQGIHDPLKHCFAGGIAGGVAAAFTTPLDCIKTLLQTKGESLDPKIRNTNTLIDAFKIIYINNGPKGFWKGLKPRIVANVPSTAICWTAYEMAKYYLTRQSSK